MANKGTNKNAGCGCLTAAVIFLIIIAAIFGGKGGNDITKKDDAQPKTATVNQSKETDAKEMVTEDTSPKSQSKYERATVTRAIDGDTVEVKFSDGKTEKVRFIGVDTPESTTQVEPYGKEAAEYTKSQIEGKTIYLEKDVSERDKYNRLLRYVWLEEPKEINENEIKSKMFNAILLMNGYAQVATYPPDVKYVDYFTKFQQTARDENKGLWAIEPSTQETASNSSEDNDNMQSTTSNETDKDRIVYYTPNGKSYHYDKNCVTLRRSKTILQGKLKDVIKIKTDPCDKCVY